jgi:cell division protein FtsL
VKHGERAAQAGKVGRCGLILSGLAAFGLSLGLVWLNVQVVTISYDIKQLKSELQSETTLNAKLEVERMHLVSDYRLQEMASRLGLQPPDKEQIRRLR